MPIISAKQVTPRNIRGVIPDYYKNRPYRELVEGDKITISSCVFSVYNARKNGEVIRTKSGEPINNITIYFGLDDGSYTSLKNDIVLAQMISLTGFDEKSDVGYYSFEFPSEDVEVIRENTKMGPKEVPVLCFQQ